MLIHFNKKLFFSCLICSLASTSLADNIIYSVGYESAESCSGSTGALDPLTACKINWPDWDSYEISTSGGIGNLTGEPANPLEEGYSPGPSCIARAGKDRLVVKVCSAIDMKRNLGESCELPYFGNPVNAATGNKYQKDTDYQSATSMLEFTRFYNSALGHRWTTSYTDYLHFDLLDDTVLTYHRPDGSGSDFKLSNGEWKTPSDTADRLKKLLSGQWQLTNTKDQVLLFDAQGKLLSKRFRSGLLHTLTYSTSQTPLSVAPKAGLLIEIADSFGHKIGLTYNSNSSIASLKDPNENTISYSYDSASRLASVTYPGQQAKTYVYGELANTANVSNPHLLTGIINENGLRYATYKYDSSGRAISTEHADGADKYQFTYNNVGTTVIDPAGTTSEIFFKNVQGKLIPIKRGQAAGSGCNSSFRESELDGSGNVTSSTDFNGIVTKYFYDALRNLEIKKVLATGFSNEKTISTEWHPTYRLPLKISQPNRITIWQYDSGGNILSKSVQGTSDSTGASGTGATPVGPVQKTTYTYGQFGLMQQLDGPRSDVNDLITFTYNSAGNIQTTSNALGQVAQFNTYDPSGRVTSLTDYNGIVTTFSYSPRGNLTATRVKHPTDSTKDSETKLNYDAVGNILSMVFPNGNTVSYEYDSSNRLKAISNVYDGRIEYSLDSAGNRISQVTKNQMGNIKRSVTQSYDTLNRLMLTLGNNGQILNQSYDANGNLLSATDGRNNKTQDTYDALNRITKVIDPNLKETKYSYDSFNRIKTVTNARGSITTYNYDELGNLISLVSPDTGTSTFTYDIAGNRMSSIDSRGVLVNYTYDALNRLRTINYPSASAENVTYTYDNSGSGNYGVGRLSSISTAANTVVAYSYNYLGQITQKKTTLNGQLTTTNYSYDLAGNITSIIYPSGRIVSYARDGSGKTLSITTKENSSTPEQSITSAMTYMPFGPLSSFSYGNGLSHTNTYDNDYRLTGISVGGVMERNYSFDPADNILGITGNVSGLPSQFFSYDKLDRLTSAAGAYGYQAFSYDDVGNRTGLLFDNGTTILSDTYNYEANSNRLSSIDKTAGGLASGVRTFTYDAAGNRIQGTGEDNKPLTFSYNNANRLSSAKAWGTLVGTYVYNALGQRISKTYRDNTKELFHYDEAGQLIAVTNATGVVQREYIYNGNQLVGFVSGGNLNFVHTDHLATPQFVTNQSQAVVWAADYEPFGKAKLGFFNSISLDSRFPGQYLDSETGLYYNYFRDYDSSIGRYIESDPIGLNGGVNTYSYADSNPLKKTDPLGLWSTEAHDFLIKRFVETNGLGSYIQGALMSGSKMADNPILGNQGDSKSYIHAMTSEANINKFQTCQQANIYMATERAKFPKQNSSPKSKWPSGNLNDGIAANYYGHVAMGKALHTIMDNRSPAHQGFQKWDSTQYGRHGDPVPFFPYGQDTEENLDALLAQPELIKQILDEMTNFYNNGVGLDCSCY